MMVKTLPLDCKSGAQAYCPLLDEKHDHVKASSSCNSVCRLIVSQVKNTPPGNKKMPTVQTKSNKRCTSAWGEIDEALDEIPSLGTAILYTLKFMLVSILLGRKFTINIHT
jgi:hypothetical protein